MGSHHGICLEKSLTVSRPGLEDFIVDLYIMSPQVTTGFASFPVNETSDIALANASVGRSMTNARYRTEV